MSLLWIRPVQVEQALEPDERRVRDFVDSPAGVSESVESLSDKLGISPAQVRELSEKKVVTVSPRAFGVKAALLEKLDEPYIDHLIKANDALPASPPVQRYVTAYADQTAIRVEVWEQAGAVASPELADNSHIGEGVIDRLPPLPKGSPIDVTFAMDRNGTLRVHAVEVLTGKALDIELHITGLDKAEVDQACDAVARYSVSG